MAEADKNNIFIWLIRIFGRKILGICLTDKAIERGMERERGTEEKRVRGRDRESEGDRTTAQERGREGERERERERERESIKRMERRNEIKVDGKHKIGRKCLRKC